MTMSEDSIFRPKEGQMVYAHMIDGKTYGRSFKLGSRQYKFFKTESEAKEDDEKNLFNYEVIKFIEEHNDGWRPYFAINTELKYYLSCNCESFIQIDSCAQKRSTAIEKHFKSQEIGIRIMERFCHTKLIKYFI